jgi:putative transposase
MGGGCRSAKSSIIKMNQNKNRKTIRLKEYDYSEPGDYFITICTQNRECLFGEVVDGEMILNEVGKIVEEEILKTQEVRKYIFIEIFQVMPNHVHLVITILCDDCRGTARRAPTVEHFGKPTINSIPTIIRSLKSAISNRIHKTGYSGYIFQRNYHEHIIRNEKSYDEIYDYILSNPSKWDEDRNNPKNFGK